MAESQVTNLTTDLGNKLAKTAAFSFGMIWDGGGYYVQTGQTLRRQMPRAGSITAWYSDGDAAGSFVLSVQKATAWPPTALTSICASAPPTATTNQYASDSTLTGWTLAFAAGDWIVVAITSISVYSKLQITFDCVGT
jgi:hypothetical protein